MESSYLQINFICNLNKLVNVLHPSLKINEDACLYVIKCLEFLYQKSSDIENALPCTELHKHALLEKEKMLKKYSDYGLDSCGLYLDVNNIRYLSQKVLSEKQMVGVLAVLEYVAAEILELSGNYCMDKDMDIIDVEDIKLVLSSDQEFCVLFKEFNH